MGNLTQALEKLDGSIDRLQESIEKRIVATPDDQNDLFGELTAERDKRQKVASSLDNVIAQLENMLEA